MEGNYGVPQEKQNTVRIHFIYETYLQGKRQFIKLDSRLLSKYAGN